MIAMGVGLFVVGAAAGGLSVYYFIKYKKDNETVPPSTQATLNAAAPPPPAAHPRQPTPNQTFMGTQQRLPAVATSNEPLQGTRNDSNPDDSL
jgi:hypothetical protein